MTTPETLVSTLARKFRLDVDASETALTGTATAATDIIAIAAHGLSNGDEIVFTAAPAPLVLGTTYYVRDKTAGNFKVAATVAGAAIDITADGAVAASGNSWLQVRAMSDFSPSIDSTLVDDSDYDSDGWGSQAKTGMAWSLTATFIRKIGVDSSAYDPGQEVIRVAADQFGPDAVVHVRWYDRDGGPEAYSGYAVVSWSPNGGNSTALDSVAVTLTGQGARTAITNPAT